MNFAWCHWFIDENFLSTDDTDSQELAMDEDGGDKRRDRVDQLEQ